MEVFTFRAKSLQEALQQVRHSLGPDASIIETRQARSGRMGLFGKPLIEVEATCDIAAAPRFSDATSELNPGVPGATRQATTPTPPNVLSASTGAPSEVTHGVNAATATAISDSHTSPYDTASESNPVGTTSTRTSKTGAPQRESAVNTRPNAIVNRQLPSVNEALADLLDCGIAPPLASSLIEKACQSCSSNEMQDYWILRAKINQLVSLDLPVTRSIEISPEQQHVAAFVGPTGVGKTTTLAKIAAGFRFELGLEVGLITLDTFRLGAVDQLLAHAELISAPLEVVSDAGQITGALQRLRECDLVLIDTAGRSPQDREQLEVLRELLTTAQPDSTHLVVSANSACAHVSDTISSFSSLKPDHLIVSKTDEAVQFGSWLGLLSELDLPVSYITSGQSVPDDISVASRRRLTSLLLGVS